MKANSEHFKGVIHILKELNKTYPNQGLARHIHEATLEYGNLWGLGDKEFHFALTKYKAELDLNIVDQKEVDEILRDGMSLSADNIEDYLTTDIDFDNGG